MLRHLSSLWCFAFFLAIPLLALGPKPPSGEEMLPKYEAAQAEAMATGKTVYLAFLGEDWSVASKAWVRDIMDSEAFQALAAERLVVLTVDANLSEQPDKRREAHLQALTITYNIKSYPTLILVAPDGREILRHGHRTISAPDYVAALEAVLPPLPSPAGE